MSDELNSNLPKRELISQPDTSIPNRALDIKLGDGDIPIFVTLISIDEILINYIGNVIQPTVVDNGRVIPVPVIYASPERWKTIRKDGAMRDPQNDKLQTPLIALRRRNISRNPMTNPSNKYVYVSYESQWNKRMGYDRFAVQNNIVPSKQISTVIVPDYVDLTYEVLIWTEYQEQMNSLLEEINVENEEWWGLRNQYKFRVRIDDYSNESELPATDQRIVRTTFNMKVSAYLVPEKMVKNFSASSTFIKGFTSKKTVIFTETENMGTIEPVGYYNKMKSS